MALKFAAIAAGVALAAFSLSGCVETGPGPGGYHSPRPVYGGPAYHRGHRPPPPRDDHRGRPGHDDHMRPPSHHAGGRPHDMRPSRDHGRPGHVDCRADPRNPACRRHR